MAEKDGLDIRYNIEIQEIDRQLHDPSAPVIIRRGSRSLPGWLVVLGPKGRLDPTRSKN